MRFSTWSIETPARKHAPGRGDIFFLWTATRSVRMQIRLERFALGVVGGLENAVEQAQKTADSIFTLVVWMLWEGRNVRCF